jgi:hypothetical protein
VTRAQEIVLLSSSNIHHHDRNRDRRPKTGGDIHSLITPLPCFIFCVVLRHWIGRRDDDDKRKKIGLGEIQRSRNPQPQKITGISL